MKLLALVTFVSIVAFVVDTSPSLNHHVVTAFEKTVGRHPLPFSPRKTASTSSPRRPAEPFPRLPFPDRSFEYVDFDYLKQHYDVELLYDHPPMILFKNFVSDEQIDALIGLVSDKFERSTVKTEREVSTYRTSSTAWIMPEVITSDPVRGQLVRDVEREIADIVQLPINNQEHFQVLRYEPGQFYKIHSDYIAEHKDWETGVRCITFFVYLSDVEEGGETVFPNVGVTVKPKKGNALLWYSTHPDSHAMDARFDHIANDVTKGLKYAANKWIHVSDFVTPWKEGRTV